MCGCVVGDGWLTCGVDFGCFDVLMCDFFVLNRIIGIDGLLGLI